jgi:hypothetical protein
LCVRFDVLAAVAAKSIILWDVVPCSPVRFYEVPLKCQWIYQTTQYHIPEDIFSSDVIKYHSSDDPHRAYENDYVEMDNFE